MNVQMLDTVRGGGGGGWSIRLVCCMYMYLKFNNGLSKWAFEVYFPVLQFWLLRDVEQVDFVAQAYTVTTDHNVS